MGGEDFSQYGLAGVPIVMYRLGVVSPRRLEQYRQAKETPPSLHSPSSIPIWGSLETGIVSMVLSAQEVLGKTRNGLASSWRRCLTFEPIGSWFCNTDAYPFL